MLIRVLLIASVMGYMTGLARAEFIAPTSEQLDAVALAPNLVVSLLSDATEAQAAGVIRDAVSRITSLGLSETQQSARIASLIKSAFAGWTGQSSTLAAALGQALATDVSLVAAPAVISAVQQSIMAMDQSTGGDASGSFSRAYQAILSAPSNAGTGPSGELVAVAPPVALTYEGQSLP